MFRVIIGIIVSLFMISLLRMIVGAISREMGGSRGATPSQAGGSPHGRPNNPSTPPKVVGGELRRCPTCGTYHAVGNIAGRTTGGELIHFCSVDCREKFAAA
jgi:hypothetical protein